MIEKLKFALTSGDEHALLGALRELPTLWGDQWLSRLKASSIMPDPSQTDRDLKEFLTETVRLASGLIEVSSDANKARDVVELAMVLFELNHWFRTLSDLLGECSLFALTPARQLQLVCAGFEDQSRLLGTKLRGMLEELHEKEGLLDPRSIRLLSMKTKTNTTGSLFDAFESKGESLELCLKYLFWKHRGQFGEPESQIDPYCDPMLVGQVFALADIQHILTMIWTVYRFKGWHADLREDVLVFDPPSKVHYMLEEVSIDRQQQYFVEFGMAAHAMGVVNPRRYLKRREKLASRVSRKYDDWLQSLPATDLRTALEELTPYDVMGSEALNKQYKQNPTEVIIDPNRSQVVLSDLLLAVKYLRVLAQVHQDTIWRRFKDEKKRYEHLCPIFLLEDLAAKLAATELLDLPTARKAIELLVFNPRSRNLEIWQQPLIPWDKERCLFLPSVAANCDTFKFVESHLAESGYSFDDRGPALEAEIRASLRKQGRQHGVRVAPHEIRFLASDGQEIEIDLLAMFQDHLIVGEAKCVKTPTEISQTHKPWPRILEGINQLKRIRRIIASDWHLIREQSRIALPPEPPDEEHIISLVITNIFTYTGQTVDGIPVCDETAFLRYFAEDGTITSTPMYKGKELGESTVLRRIWSNNSPTPADFKAYLLKPPQVEMALEGHQFEYQPVPSINESVRPLAFLRFAPNPTANSPLVRGHEAK